MLPGGAGALVIERTMMTQYSAHRGRILHFIANPALTESVEHAYQYFADGLLIINNGLVEAVGEYAQLKERVSPEQITQHGNKLILPGFIDTHLHFPQMEMIAAYGKQLLDWLNTYTFPFEQRFADIAYASERAELFLEQLCMHGTTTALTFATVHPTSVDALFSAAEKRNMRMLTGKVMMDRHAPDALMDTPESSYHESKALIEKWHGKGRNLYAVTPRFAPTSTAEQLAKAGQLLSEYDGLYMQTHLSENKREIAWVKELFPEAKGYLDVYDQFGLLGPRSVFAHGVHLEEREYWRLYESGSSISFCPTSNLFLGSGLFDVERAQDMAVNFAPGSDVGAGTSFSMLQTMNEAYKVAQLNGYSMSAFEMFYHITLGGARTLQLDDKIGSFNVGNEADFVVLDPDATPLMKMRLAESESLMDELFVYAMLGDDRAIEQTYIMGKQQYHK